MVRAAMFSAVGACALAACAPGEAFLDSGDDWRAALVVHVDGAEVHATAYALTEDAPVRRDIPESGELYTIGYADELSALGLAAGPLPLAAAGDPLPSGGHVHLLDDGAWRALPVAPPVLAALRLPARSRCARYTVAEHTVVLEAGSEVTAAVPLDPIRVLLATDAGRFYTVGVDGVSYEEALSTTVSVAGGFARGDGLAWMIGFDGALLHGTLAGGWIVGPPAPLPDQRTWSITGAVAGHPLELFATNDHLVVVHYDGQRWRTVRGGPADGDYRPRRAHTSLTWLEPGVALFTGAGTSSVAEVHADGTARVVRVDVPATPQGDAPFSAGRVEGGPALLATRESSLFARVGGAYEAQPRLLVDTRPEIIFDIGGGATLIGGSGGVLFERRPDGTYCEPFVVGSGSTVYRVATLGTGFVAVSLDGVDRARVSIATR